MVSKRNENMLKEGVIYERPPKKLIKKGGVKNGWNIPTNHERGKGWKEHYLYPQMRNRVLAYPMILIIGGPINHADICKDSE